MVSTLVLMAAVVAQEAGGVPPGTPIVTIVVVRDDIFNTSDPETSSWPYRWANALHVLTRERYIRSLLLFKEGDKLDPAQVAESERILRGTGFLSPVTITARPVPGGAEVTVRTHDQWTMLVGASFGLAGNRTHMGGSLSEDNFLGWGKQVLTEYDSSTERTITTLRYKDSLLLGTRWQLRVQHRKLSDGKDDEIDLAYPFFALATPRAGGVSWLRSSLTEYLYVGSHHAVEGTTDATSFQLWGGVRMPWDSGTTDRLTFGVFKDSADFSDWRTVDGRPYPTPEGHFMQGVLVGWDHQVDRWLVVSGFRAWQRQEDVALGPNWTVTAGVSTPAFGGDRTRIKLTGLLNLAFLSGRQFSWLNVGSDGRLESGALVNQVTHLDAGTARTGDVGWRARISLDLGHELDGDRQLTLGADTGLRGWDPDTFDGTSRAVANLEWRHVLTGEVLHLGIIGGVVFADAGKTWAPRVGPSTDGVRGDFGVGLLIESTRAALLRVIRVEVARPDRGGKAVFLISGTSLF